MRIDVARTLRGMLCAAGFLIPLSLLMLSACGSGGGGGGGVPGSPNLIPIGLTVSTFSGTANPGADGVASAARFNGPYSSASDGINLYVADSGNHTIRRIAISTGTVATLAGKAGVAGAADGFGSSARFNFPTGITIDNTHTNLYVVDSGNNKIRQVAIATGAVSSLTGAANAPVTAGATDGAGASASFNNPRGITTDGITLYVADTGNQKIRRVDITSGTVGSVTGLANFPAGAGALDGTPSIASFNNPTGIALDGSQTVLYVADAGNNKIRQVLLFSGVVSSFTGAASAPAAAGAADGPAAAASFSSPLGIAADAANVYVADSSNNKIRQIVIATGAVTSLTGASGVAGTAGAADGAESAATFSRPTGITVVGTGLLIADFGNNTIRNIATLFGQVSTLAGSAASFSSPRGAVSDGTNLYIADSGNNTIRKIVIATGALSTLAGQSGVAGAADGPGASATFSNPGGIATDGANLYVADTNNNKIRKIVISTGAVSSLTGASGVAGTPGSADGAGAAATFNDPSGIATDGASLYVADTANNKIRQVVIATGAVSSLTGVANTAATAGAQDGAAPGAAFSLPFGITIDSTHTNLYVADTGNNKIRQVVIATGTVSSFTGAANTAVAAGAADGAAATASFSQPHGIATDGTSLYVADTNNNKIRSIAIATGTASSFTGLANTAGAAGFADGAPSAATFSAPNGITVVGGTLYVADTGNNTIRRIQ